MYIYTYIETDRKLLLRSVTIESVSIKIIYSESITVFIAREQCTIQPYRARVRLSPGYIQNFRGINLNQETTGVVD